MSGCNFSHPLASALRRGYDGGREREELDGWGILDAHQEPPTRVHKTFFGPWNQGLIPQQLTFSRILFEFLQLSLLFSSSIDPTFYSILPHCKQFFDITNWHFTSSIPSVKIHFSTITSALVFGLMAIGPAIAKPVDLDALAPRAVSN